MHRGDQFLFTVEFNNGYNSGTCTPFAGAWKRRKQAKRQAKKLELLTHDRHIRIRRSKIAGTEGRKKHLDKQVKRLTRIIEAEIEKAA